MDRVALGSIWFRGGGRISLCPRHSKAAPKGAQGSLSGEALSGSGPRILVWDWEKWDEGVG